MNTNSWAENSNKADVYSLKASNEGIWKVVKELVTIIKACR